MTVIDESVVVPMNELQPDGGTGRLIDPVSSVIRKSGSVKVTITPCQPKTLSHLPKRPPVDIAFSDLDYTVSEGNKNSEYYLYYYCFYWVCLYRFCVKIEFRPRNSHKYNIIVMRFPPLLPARPSRSYLPTSLCVDYSFSILYRPIDVRI